MIVNYNADDIRQETAALGADAIEGQKGRRCHMQPLRFPADAESRLVHVLDRRAGHEITHRLDKFPTRSAQVRLILAIVMRARGWRWPAISPSHIVGSGS